MGIRRYGCLFIPITIIGLIIYYITISNRFDKSIEQYSIIFKVPEDFAISTNSSDMNNYPTNYFPSGENKGVICGYDKNGNYYRVMWMKSVFDEDIDEKEILEKYDDLEKLGNTILPIQNSKIKKINNDYSQNATEKFWPWISGEKHKLLEYKKSFAGKDGKIYYNTTYIWYCDKTKRMFNISFESNEENKYDNDIIYFVGNLSCHKE
jgi:hypothetical protein